MNKNIFELLDAINEFKKTNTPSKARMIMQRFFPKNVAFAAVSIQLFSHSPLYIFPLFLSFL